MVIAPAYTELCPVGMFVRYAKLAALGQDQETFIFRGIVSTKFGDRLRGSYILGHSGHKCDLGGQC